jgi:2-desacetyl-2-hydroxyethyl bacteriochlorophyllide A dehydrogenase
MTEYLSVPSYALFHGDGLSLDQLALLEPLAIGAHGVGRALVQPGENVLIVGAGPIGLGTIEFARLAGANVIVMDVREQRLQFCKDKLKVSHQINAISDDVTGKLHALTDGEMPSVIIDCTGNLKAINQSFQYLAHGGRYVLIGLQKGEICFSHPEFHKREATLMSSRNAIRADFEKVSSAMRNKEIDPDIFITHRVHFDKVKDEFEKWLDPANHMIKAMVEMA